MANIGSRRMRAPMIELVFDDGGVAKIRMRIKYTGYKVGRTEVRILDDEPTPTPTPTPKKP